MPGGFYISSYNYPSTVAAYGDVFMLPLSAENRAAAGVKAGDQAEVTIELDPEPRIVDVPDDLAAAISEKPGATAAFEALSYSMRMEYVRQDESAKAQETRNWCMAAIVAKLSEG